MITQDKALSILKSGRNVFLTGSAGAGKTYVLNQYINYLKDCEIPVAITASTGIAATHMNGMTIHSWAGIGVRESIGPKDLAAMKEKKYMKDKMESVKVLIIDEISMLHKQQLELVNYVLRGFKDASKPFGGVQVVFAGDFFQLPPVGKPSEEPRDKFAFMSQAWLEAEPQICYINEQHRQSDNRLNALLNHIRDGSVDARDLDLLNSAMIAPETDYAFITRLYTHNYDVDRLNRQYLDALKSKVKSFQAEMKGNETLRDMLKKSVLTDAELELKNGAIVMFIKNNYEAGYMNGTTGEISGFSDDGYPLVRIQSGSTIEALPEEWSIQDDNGKVLASFKQVPLRLAWAITIHKSQGMTLDAALIDLSRTFERGQGYVALSRLRDTKGLFLAGFNAMALEVDALVARADRRFRELSAIAGQLNADMLIKDAVAFIDLCGGVLPGTGRKKKGKKQELRGASGNKVSTYQQTAELVNKGMDLKSIVKFRSLSAGTIIGHLQKLKETCAVADFSALKPDDALLNAVKAAQKTLIEANGDPQMKPGLTALHAQTKGQFSFDEIRLAQIFIE